MADGCLTRTLEGDELDGMECGELRTRGGRTNGQTSFGEEGDGRKLTRRTIFMRSSGSVFGSLLEGSILWTTRGKPPVPSFSTRRWLRKSSSRERSRMFMIFVGRHAPLRTEVEPAIAGGMVGREARSGRARRDGMRERRKMERGERRGRGREDGLELGWV